METKPPMMLSLALALALQADPDRLLAFPGAEGAGATARGGRGGKVLFVTTLEDSGPGSLREAIEAEGPRTVIFRVSGIIRLKKSLSVRKPYLTLAGQTAPGDGVCIADRSFSIGADHVVCRYLRFRTGDLSRRETDALSVYRARNVIIDHCSVGWSNDEVLSVTGEGCGDVTVQWSLITESLNKSHHRKGEHGYGSLIRTDGPVTFHHNLYAHHKTRCPRPGTYGKDPGITLDFRNNVVYNWVSPAGYTSGDPARINYVGNYLKPGPSTRDRERIFRIGGDATRMFVEGNLRAGAKGRDWELIDRAKERHRSERPFPIAAVRTDDAETAFRRVLKEAGATRPFRDAVDRRVIDEVRRGGGRIIDSQKDVGGWPPYGGVPPALDADRDGMIDAWERRHGLDPEDRADGKGDPDDDGYLNLEEFLNETDPRKKDPS